MQIFISWSGSRSRHIADAIRNWLPMVIQSVKPWMSDEDIAAGSRWLTEVSSTLNNAKVGIICVTPENQHNPWLLFEAGALSKTLDQTCVCPLLYEITTGQLDGPLTQFQANLLNRDGIGKVIATINKGLGERQIEVHQLDQILDVWWPKLEEKVQNLPKINSQPSTRAANEQLEELLTLARENMRRENLRLEASREREERLDYMVNFLEKVAASISTFQTQAQLFTAQIPEAAIMPGSPFTRSENKAGNNNKTATSKIGTIIPDALNSSSINQMAEILREIQEKEKQHTESLLSPPS